MCIQTRSELTPNFNFKFISKQKPSTTTNKSPDRKIDELAFNVRTVNCGLSFTFNSQSQASARKTIGSHTYICVLFFTLALHCICDVHLILLLF